MHDALLAEGEAWVWNKSRGEVHNTWSAEYRRSLEALYGMPLEAVYPPYLSARVSTSETITANEVLVRQSPSAREDGGWPVDVIVHRFPDDTGFEIAGSIYRVKWAGPADIDIDGRVTRNDASAYLLLQKDGTLNGWTWATFSTEHSRALTHWEARS